jgi:outer membrane immunogenic protein
MSDTGNNLLPASTTLGFNLDSLGTVRGRVGVSSDRLLLFGTGGLAYGLLETNGRITLDGARISNDSTSDLRFGWALGAGLEYALDKNWLIGADYLFADLGNGKADTKSAIPTAFEFGETGNMELRFSLTRITLKYRF